MTGSVFTHTYHLSVRKLERYKPALADWSWFKFLQSGRVILLVQMVEGVA